MFPLQLLLLLLLQTLSVPSARALYFEDGYDHHYTYSSESDILGMHNVTTVIKFRIRSVNGSLYMLMVDSLVQHSESGYTADNALKWKLDHRFYFNAGQDGLITLVLFHPEEKDEVLTLKKVLASTLSTKVTIGQEDSYVSLETDHAGVLEHEYTAERHTEGVRITKGHKSSESVHRSHNKTFHMDLKGTPLYVESLDNVTMRNEPSGVSRTPAEGVEDIPEEVSGDFPKIASISVSTMRLTAKNKHYESGHHNLETLKKDTLLIKEIPKAKQSLPAVEPDIQKYVACIHSIPNKYDRNRTECVHELRNLVTSLERDDFLKLGKETLTKECPDDDVICKDERNLFIDVVANEGSADAQLLMLNHVMLHSKASEEDVRRCLFHCIAIKSPVVELVEYVEELCFKDDPKPGETPAMSKNRIRACLSLGAMSKSLHDQNATVSDRIVERIENWLNHHDEVKSKSIVKPRRRRSIIQHDMRARKHVETKMVLIQSLGNAGKQRSLEHIKSYMAPNVGVTAWRRAAIHSLRHFDCNESATHLVISAVHDDNEVVRKAAIHVLKKRHISKPDSITEEHENIVLRVRRSLLKTLEEGIYITIEPPGFAWDHVIGTTDIGASFGITIRNLLDLKLGLLDGHFMVDIYDGAYAEAHVGMINLKVDIVLAYVCFKGHIQYDLNVIKDFGINSLSDLVHIYDKIIGKIINPIKDAVTNFNDIITMFKNGGLTKIINTLVAIVKNLPNLLGDVASRMEDFVKEIFSISGSTVVEEIRTIVMHVRQFVDDVKLNILNFYNNIVDAVTMALPYIGKKIVEASNLIVEGMKALFTNPMQGITAMSRAINDVKMAVTMFADVRSSISDACSFIKGRTDVWLNTAKEIPSILKRLAEAFNRLSLSKRNRGDQVIDMRNGYSNDIENTNQCIGRLEEDLEVKWEHVIAPLKPLMHITEPFMEEYKSVMDVVDAVKKSYKTVKETIESSKKLIQKVFGPKFHKSFPTYRRPMKGRCPEGVWPSTTEGHYKTIGVDLRLGVAQPIKMPVNGILHVDGHQRVVVQPTDDEFLLLEIVIENIILAPFISENKQYTSGVKIGRAGKASKCEPNFIHVSVRQKVDGGLPDADYKYTDPGPFLDRLLTIPKWIQECSDHEFRYIGQTFESGESTDAANPDESKEPIAREPDPDFHGIDGLKGSEPYRPDEDRPDETPFKESLLDDIKGQKNKFTAFFKIALFGGDGPKIPNILDIIDISGKKVDFLIDNLKDVSLTKELNEVIGGLCAKMTAVPLGNPLTFSIPYIKSILEMNGLPPTISDMSKLSDQLMNVAENACPIFKGAIAPGFGHVCTVHEDCLGLVCSVPLPKCGKVEYVHVGASINATEGKVDITVNGNLIKQIIADGRDVEFDTNIKFFGMNLFMSANVEFKQGVMSLWAEVKLCESLYHTCLPSIELFREIAFQTLANFETPPYRGKGKLAMCAGITALSIPKFLNKLGDFQLLGKNITGVIDKVRSTVVTKLLEDAADTLGQLDTEFSDKIDFCISANIPVPSMDIEFFNEIQPFMVGPVPLSLGFGAGGSIGLSVRIGLCVLSMTTQLTITPWLGGKVWGSVALDIGFARGGIELVGYLVETKFPMTTELVFSKYPIDVGSKMDLILRPIRLKLKAIAELYVPGPITEIKRIFEAELWEYKCELIKKNIFHKKKRDDDPSPPDIMPATISDRAKREGIRGCIVHQVIGRPYYSPAFTLEMHAQDEVSEVKLSYAIGSHPGGTNIVAWTEMGGNSLMAPGLLPGGIPLYWTVKAKNTQGLEATQQCSLNTFDSTLPDGRVEHSYKYSSHPYKLSASVIVVEDSPLIETHYKAVGLSPGQFGSQFVNWEPLRLDQSLDREGVSGYLKHFTVPREGKLVTWVLQSQELRTPELCAQKCIQYGQNCMSFSYEYHSETCDLHDIVEGANAYLRISGTYSNYERLGVGYNTPIEYDHLELTQGTLYFVNTKVTNVLGYEAYLTGQGTMVDFTPPEPGLIRNAIKDILQADNCTASISQRCIEVTLKNNHRIIVDGEGSGTVFNGHRPVFDQLYTLTNHYVTSNWKGFHDDESDIWGYTWAVGSEVCGSDIMAFKDPYSHLTNKKFWTDSAFHKGIHLEDGAYYVTVQALNGAELGGSLVTTVCHSTPFIVDTSPPVFNSVTDIIYDEDFDLIAIYYDAEDSLSKIAKAEFGLGKTKYDVQLKPYSLHASMDRDDPFVAVEDLGLQEGIPAWLRIRVTNNVDLFTAGHGDEPIMIDKSPPTAGTVFDGDRLRQDRTYQSDTKSICAQWINFYDEQSGIDRFLWGVGTAPKLNDIVAFRNLTHYDKTSCAPASLQHNHTYFSTVFAYNNALNSKSCNSSSDGVLIDITPPLPGIVFDGIAGKEELKYTSETVSKYANWWGYYDPESGIAEYKVDVYVNGEHKKTFDVDTETEFKDHTISMDHLDQVQFTVHGVNGAELEVTADSDGFLVDHTPPVMTAISDNDHGSAYQSYNDNMQLSWNFYDSESHIKEYRTVIYETKHGIKQNFWPRNEKYNTTSPPSPTNGRMAVKLENLEMKDGALYTIHVTALNNALLATSHETTGVTVDTTHPGIPTIKLGIPKEEEEVDDKGRVLHNDQHAIRLSWSGRDSESGIEHYLVAIGTEQDQEGISPFVDYGIETTAFIQHINFQTFTEKGITYRAFVKATNGAGLESDVGQSKPIVVQKANIPGVVFDGRDLFTDAMYTIDGTSIAASFYGFASESCNIISYEWAIGTTEYYTDVLSYTDYGVVMLNDTHGQAQVHIGLFEDTTYYITVRAVTGCHDEFILAASDGITFDRTPPVVVYKEDPSNDSTTVFAHGVLFQDVIDTLAITSNVSDKHSVDSTSWALGSLPLLQDRHPFSSDLETLTRVFAQQPGKTTFITTDTVDKAGNREITSSFAIMSDDTAPQIQDLQCTEFLSYRKSLLTCDWVTLVESESLIDKVTVTVTTNEDHTILDEYTMPRGVSTFSRDLYHELNSMKNVTRIYATFVISNIVGQKKDYGQDIVVDISKPDIEKLEVVTSLSQTPAESHQKCQLPRAFVELRVLGAKDEESEIDTERYEVSLGLTPYGTEFKNYVPINQRVDGTFFLDDFTLNVGTVFYATLRVCNKAGLCSDVTSESVVVSQAPRLTVIDGIGEEDDDYQAVPNLIQGRWQYSDPCPIREAKWMVEDLTGKVLFDYMTIPSSGRKFYNDEVTLENGKKYITTVKTIDFLNRTRMARSDGVTVRIQPPFPGHVRDGVAEDMNYQYSTTELSCNWDPFGDTSNDPTQSIHHYEVSIGNDRRYEKSRSNVHYFQNVGLNTSHTFKHLNLTGKLIRYYITVRSYSMAGGYAEGYSNGIRVGYHDEIGPGEVSLSSYQSQVDSIAVSWTGFKSDINILLYKVGISSQEPDLSNGTLKCSNFGKNVSVYDVSDLESIGLNEYVKIEHISLDHGKEYYVTVIAEDEAGMCIAVTSMPTLVDTTQPVTGDLYINDVKSDIISFATSDSEMHVMWENFNDAESGIAEIKISLLECSSCHPDVESQECKVFAENVVQGDVKTAFYDIELYTSKSYVVRVDLRNGANLHTVLSSATILIDSSPPLPGEVKISNDWYKLSNFQHSTTRISGLFALASTREDYICKNQIPFFPSNEPELWQKFSDSFSNKFQVLNNTGAYLGIGYDTNLTTFLRSGIVSDSLKLAKGNYSFTIRTARGNKIVTTATFLSDVVSVPFKLHDKPRETVFDYSLFDNMTGLQASNDSGTLNTTDEPTTTPKQSVKIVSTNETDFTEKTLLNELAYGCGIHFLGYQIGNNKGWWHVFWARNKFASLERWFRVSFDPTLAPHEYTVNLKQEEASGNNAFDLTLYVDGEEIVSISGFDFNSDIKFSTLVWNEDNYKPPIASVFKPFYSEATLSRIDIPDITDKQCLHGKGFFDGESGIKEIWMGISDSTDEMGNIRPLQIYQSFCFPCIEPCDDMCLKPCNDTHVPDKFTLFTIQIDGLDLKATDANSTCLNVYTENKCNSTVYYLNAKVVNFAGEETDVYSNGIQIDVTPPVCEYVRCVDPDFNGDQPTTYLGSNSSIGAYWNCEEDVSLIDYYTVKIVSVNSSKTIMNSTEVNLQTKVSFDLGSGTFEDRHLYEVQVTATNTAGLSLKSSCTIEVLLFAPDVSSTSYKPLFIEDGSEADDEAPYFTNSQDVVGLGWAGGSPDTQYYEYAIGASQDAPDILPPTLVGGSPSGTVAISGGRLKLDTTLTNTSMLDLLDRRNMTNEELADLEASPEHKKTFFNIEPGRCMHQTLYAVGYSHRKSKIQGKTVCNKRVNDVNSGSSNNSHVIISKVKSSRKWEKTVIPSPEIAIDAQVLSGSMSVGSLDEADKTSEYGSAATADFKPYISDPSLTRDQTTRMLRNRIQKFCDMSFYMAPSPAVNVEYVKINVTVPPSCAKDPDYQPALVYWDVENKLWTHTDEGCSDTPTSHMDALNNVYMAEVCTEQDTKRRRRDTIVTLTTPIQYEVVRISRVFPNNPPTIVSDVIYTQEDNFKELLVETSDLDHDTLIFDLLGQPENANCTIGTMTGILNCTLEEHFNGLNYMDVKVTETGLPETEQPMSVVKTVMLNITATPDATERFFLDRFGTLLEDVRPFMNHSLTVEANDTETVFAGTIVLADMDDGEVFTETTEFTALGNSTFSLEKFDGEEIGQKTNMSYKTLQAYNVTFKYSSQLHGSLTLKFIAQTATNEYTPSVTLNVFVLENPCVYGYCDHLSLGTSACQSIDRATSFDDYICVCTPGYKGTWCQIEVDECETNQCSTLYDCDDLVNDYACNINVGKLMAILICCSLALVCAGFLIYKMKTRLDQYMMRKRQASLTDDDQPNEIEVDIRPLTPFLNDKRGTCAAMTNPGFTNTDVDLSALSNITAQVGHIAPPHHALQPSVMGTSKSSFVSGKNKFSNPGTSNTFGLRASKPSIDLGKPKRPQMPTESVAPSSEPGFISVFTSGHQGPSQRCPSAASQRTVSTIDGEQIMLSERITDIDV